MNGLRGWVAQKISNMFSSHAQAQSICSLFFSLNDEWKEGSLACILPSIA